MADNIQELYEIVQSLPIIDGKDCSEYAEDIVSFCDRKVAVKTIRAVNERGNGEQFIISSNICNGPYFYHTIVVFMSKHNYYVADVFHPNKIVELNYYIQELKYLNQSKSKRFIMYTGDYDTFDMMVNTIEKLKRQGIKIKVL